MLDSLASELTMEGGGPLPIKGLHHKFPNVIDIDVIDKQVSKLHYGDVVTLSLHGMFVNAKDKKLNTERVSRIIYYLTDINKMQGDVLRGRITDKDISKSLGSVESFVKYLTDYTSKETLYSNTDLATTTVTKGDLVKWILAIRKLILPWQTSKASKNLEDGVYDPDQNPDHPVNTWEDGSTYTRFNHTVETIADQLDEVYVQLYRIVQL